MPNTEDAASVGLRADGTQGQKSSRPPAIAHAADYRNCPFKRRELLWHFLTAPVSAAESIKYMHRVLSSAGR